MSQGGHYLLVGSYLLVRLVLGGPRTNLKNPPKYQKHSRYENCSHFVKQIGFLFERMFNNSLYPCSHIELNTLNPNTIFKK